MNGFQFYKGISLIHLRQKVIDEIHLCKYCCKYNADYKTSCYHLDFFEYYSCENCFDYDKIILCIDDIISKNMFSNVMRILINLNIYEIPHHILYDIGKKSKNINPIPEFDLIFNESIATFNTTCDSARRAIREFCLYCIRYQKDKLNKDIRRKICELIWDDKIKFIS